MPLALPRVALASRDVRTVHVYILSNLYPIFVETASLFFNAVENSAFIDEKGGVGNNRAFQQQSRRCCVVWVALETSCKVCSDVSGDSGPEFHLLF